jgi:glycosyltransferase involved in cell wall biosynthesis
LYLIQEILPLLQVRGLHSKVLIAGARPGRKIRNLEAMHSVTVKGWVEDIREAYADGRIFVAPMFTGLGLQNKILEAMAMGLACVTTSMVNNAIGAVPGEQILLGDSPEQLTHHIEKLLTNEDYRLWIASAGKEFVLKHYQWEDQAARLDAVLVSRNIFV